MHTESIDSQATTEPIHNIVTPELVTLIDVSTDTYVEQIKLQLIDQINVDDTKTVQDLDKTMLFTLLPTVMEIVETSDFKGSEQKDIVIQILVSVLESDLVKSTHKDDLLLFLHNDANNVIDIIVDASKGKLNINNVKNITTRLVTYLFACLKKNKV